MSPGLQISSFDEKKWLVKIREQDPSAKLMLFEHFGDLLYGLISRMAGREKADTLLQDFLEIIPEAALQYSPDRIRFLSWLINRTRRFVQEKVGKEIIIHNSAITETNKFNNLIHLLEVEYREVIDVLYFGGLNPEEAAKYLNIPLGTLKTRCASAIQKLMHLCERMKVSE